MSVLARYSLHAHGGAGALEARAPAIFEASFDGGGVFAAVDILERHAEGQATRSRW
jgi:hypothetical protein